MMVDPNTQLGMQRISISITSRSPSILCSSHHRLAGLTHLAGDFYGPLSLERASILPLLIAPSDSSSGAERQLFRRFARRSSWTSPFSTSTRSRTDRPSGIRGPVGYLHRSHNFVPVPLLDISIVAQPTIILYLTAPLILIASTSITTSIPDPETHLPGRFPRRRRLLLFSDVALARRGET